MSEPVKKRSLGSYLSRIGERRKERERLEQKQNELKSKEEEETSQPGSGAGTPNDAGSEQEKIADRAVIEEPATQTTKTEAEPTPAPEAASSESVVPLKEEKVITTEEEKITTTEPAPAAPEDEVPVPKVGKQKSKNKSDEDSSALSEIESDAPTEPASPPRPRKGRLIRGDQLESANNSRQSSVPVLGRDGHDGMSESELSDLSDTNAGKISSSIIHEDSSPVKHYENKRRASGHIEHQNSTHKRMKHVGTSKVPKHKKSVHRDAGGRTKLQIACDKGKYDLAKRLIEEEGYDVNDQDNAGNTPLHEAALNGHLSIVKLLVKHGADVNRQSYDMFLDTPLIDASANGHLPVVKYLLDHGADPTMVNAKGLSAIESIEEESDMDTEDRKIVYDMKDLLKRAARKYMKHSHRSIQSSSLSRHSDDTEKQLNHDDDFYWTDISSKTGKSKLLRASKEGKLAYVGSYLENGGRPDFKCFLESCMYGHDDVVSLFLAFGAQVNMSNKEGQTPLMLSVGRGHVNVVKLLIEAGADPGKKDKNHKTALNYAKHSSLGLTDPEEITLLKETIKKQYGYVVSDTNDEDDEEEEEKEGDEEEEEEEGEKKNKKRKKVQEDRQENKAEAKAKSKPKPESEKESSYGTSREPSSVLVPIKTEKRQEEPVHSEKTPPVVATEPHTKHESRTASPEALSLTGSALEKFDTRSSSSVSTHAQARSVSVSHQTSTPPPLPKETEEEKAERLKSEEEYRQKRLLQKKRKEQEFLNKLAEDERKRIEEKEKLKQQELERQEKARQEQLLKEEELRNKAEIQRRIKIRESYPMGLRSIDFKDLANYQNFGPVYYFTDANSSSTWVLDLQMSVITKENVESLQQACSNVQPVQQQQYPQLWNLYKHIFLYGGTNNSDLFNALPWKQRLQMEQQEYKKFAALPLHWIDLTQLLDSNLLTDHQQPVGNWISSNLIEFVPVSTTSTTTPSYKRTHARDPAKDPSTKRLVPPKYLLRSKVQPWLNSTKALW